MSSANKFVDDMAQEQKEYQESKEGRDAKMSVDDLSELGARTFSKGKFAGKSYADICRDDAWYMKNFIENCDDMGERTESGIRALIQAAIDEASDLTKNPVKKKEVTAMKRLVFPFGKAYKGKKLEWFFRKTKVNPKTKKKEDNTWFLRKMLEWDKPPFTPRQRVVIKYHLDQQEEG